MLVGGVVKVVVNYILVGNPNIGILGAPVGTLACFTVYMLLNLFTMRRVMDALPRILPALWRSGLAAVLMGVAAWGTYALLSSALSSVTVCCLGAIAVAVVVYLVLVLVFRGITREDCMLLPKGEKIVKLLRIR